MKRYYSVKITIAALALSTALCGCSLFGGTSSSRTLSEVSLPTTEEMVLKYDGYGFQVLQTKAEQRLYAGIDAAVQKNVSEEFVTENLDDVSRVSDVIEFYKDDHPEVFWIDDTEPYYYSEEGELLNIMLNYRLSGDELTAAKQALEEKVEEAVNGAPETDDSYTLEMYAHDCVIAACEYDELSTKLHKIDKVRSNEQNVYGVFVEKKAVCEGYARAFQLLCDRLELPCWVIQGKAKSSDDDEAVNHIWNCVMLDDDWYQVDVTWDDTDGEAAVDCENYLYFNLTTKIMTIDHEISPSYSDYSDSEIWYNGFVPECDSTEYYYFRRNAMTLESLDDESAVTYLAEIATNGDDECVFVIGDDLDFKTTYDEIVSRYAYEWITQANEINGYYPALNAECKLTYNEDRRLVVLSLEEQQ